MYSNVFVRIVITVYFSLLENDVVVLAISCNDILRDGSVKDFSKDDILTLSTSTPQQLETCLFILGKDEIDAGRAKAVWTVIKQIYGSVDDVPEESLKQLGWIISGIPAEDFYNITISDIDTVSIFGFYRNLSDQQLLALKQATDNQWGRKLPEQLNSYDLAALRQILCAFNETEIAAIHPDSYRDAAGDLATLRNCPKSVLIQLVNLATNDAAFGNPSTWNAIQVTSIGYIIAGLPSANVIPAESMEGITPHIVKCIPPSFLQTMSEKQLQQFTTNAAASISNAQREFLSSDQRYALEQAAVGVKYKRRNSAAVSRCLPLRLFTFYYSLYIIYSIFSIFIANKSADRRSNSITGTSVRSRLWRKAIKKKKLNRQRKLTKSEEEEKTIQSTST